MHSELAEQNLVVGGGMMGLAVAYELARRGEPVCVLEAAAAPGHGASFAAAGMVPRLGACTQDPAVMALSGASWLQFGPWVRELEARGGVACGYVESGMLWVAFDRVEAEALAAKRELWGAGVVALTPGEILAREPRLSPELHSGWYVPHCHQVDPRALTESLLAALRVMGVPVLCGSRVCEVAHDARGVRGVWLDQADPPRWLPARRVVVTAGAWTSALESPYRALGVRPVKGQVVRLRGPGMLRHLVGTAATCLVPRPQGDLLVAATVEECGFDVAPTAQAVLELLQQGQRLLPGLQALEFVECAVGLRPAVNDGRPVIGAGAAPGLFVATGHHRNGVLLAPATAGHLVEGMLSGTMPAALAPFAPERLLHPASAAPTVL